MLTEKRIRDARAADKTTFIWDSRVKNFGVRITGKGAKSYVLFYRTGGRKHLATLARCSEVSLAEARQRAGRELAVIRDGEADPLAVEHQQVVLRQTKSADGRISLQATMRPVPVVSVEPVRQLLCALA